MPLTMPRGMLTLAGRDLADFGFAYRGSSGSLFGRMEVGYPATPVDGAAGELVLGRTSAVSMVPLPLEVFFQGDSPAECQTAIDQITHWMTLGPALLWQKRRPTQVTVVAGSVQASLFVPVRELGRKQLRGTLTFRRHPYYFDQYPMRVVSNGAGFANRVEIPTGTAPSAVQCWVTDASNPTIIQRAADGTIVGQSLWLLGLALDGDYGILDGARRRAIKADTGTLSDVPSALQQGSTWPVADPRWAWVEAGRYQTLEVSAGRLFVDVRRAWLA